jgi:hypothetical protein
MEKWIGNVGNYNDKLLRKMESTCKGYKTV